MKNSSTKIQISNKSQLPKFKIQNSQSHRNISMKSPAAELRVILSIKLIGMFRKLVFRIWILFGIWVLGFGILVSYPEKKIASF
jgi:hypothetical protein